MSPAQARSGALGQGLAGDQIRGGFVGSAVAGFWDEGLGLDGVQGSLGHDAPDSGGGASHAPVGEFLGETAVPVTPAVAPEDGSR